MRERKNMSESKISEKEFWEAKGLKYYDNAWEAVGINKKQEIEIKRMKAKKDLLDIQTQSEKNGNSKMSLREINKEIKLARQERNSESKEKREKAFWKLQRLEFAQAVRKMQIHSEKNGNSKMSLEEINEAIADARKAK